MASTTAAMTTNPPMTRTAPSRTVRTVPTVIKPPDRAGAPLSVARNNIGRSWVDEVGVSLAMVNGYPVSVVATVH